MKHFFITLISFFSILFISGQTIKDARNHMYYQRYESAKTVLKNIISKGAESPDVWYWLGEIYLDQNKSDSAKLVFQDGLNYANTNNLTPKSYPLIYIGDAQLKIESGAIEEGEKEIQDILSLSKYKDVDALLAAGRANIESKNGDIALAFQYLNKAEKRDKKNAEIYTALGDANRKIINGGEAILSYDKAIDADPSFAEAMYKKGLIYKSQNNTEVYMDRFTKAIQMDVHYTPALYELYNYYSIRNIKKASEIFKAYFNNSEPSLSNDYLTADYLYLSKDYSKAIEKANMIISSENNKTQPRLYKMIAYCQAASGDSSAAQNSMDQYFKYQKPADIVPKDYELMALLTDHNLSDKSIAVGWYRKALSAEQDSNTRLNYMLTLADLQKDLGNRVRESVWREKIYKTKDSPTNMDLYKWGLALYSSTEYQRADSVFDLYEIKYPDQVYGYLWRARCNALIDSTMELGLAIPHYKKMIEIALKDSAKNLSNLLMAYGYMGAYEANITRDFEASLEYFNKILQIDPSNNDAKKYAELLNQWIESGKS